MPRFASNRVTGGSLAFCGFLDGLPRLLPPSFTSLGFPLDCICLCRPPGPQPAVRAAAQQRCNRSGNLRVGWHFVRSFRQGFVTSSCALFSKHPEYAKHHCTPTHSVFGHAAALREQSRNGRLAGFLWLFARLSWLLPPSYYSLGFFLRHFATFSFFDI